MRREPTFDDVDDGFEPEDIRPLAAPKPFRRIRLTVQLCCAAAVIAGLSLAARDGTGSSGPPGGWVEPSRPSALAVRAAIPVSASPAMLTIDAGPLEQPVRVESPHWSAATGRREDGLAQGQFDAIDAPYLRITVGEASPDAEPNPGLFVILARRAADLRGLSIARTAARGTLETKFGPFETVDVTLQGEGSRICTGFQSVGSAPIRVDGWLCGILGQAPEPSAVTCSIDRLRLAAPAIGPLEAAFTEAEKRRAASCDGPSSAASAPRIGDATGSIGQDRTAGKTRPTKNESKARQTAQARQ